MTSPFFSSIRILETTFINRSRTRKANYTGVLLYYSFTGFSANPVRDNLLISQEANGRIAECVFLGELRAGHPVVVFTMDG